ELIDPQQRLPLVYDNAQMFVQILIGIFLELFLVHHAANLEKMRYIRKREPPSCFGLRGDLGLSGGWVHPSSESRDLSLANHVYKVRAKGYLCGDETPVVHVPQPRYADRAVRVFGSRRSG